METILFILLIFNQLLFETVAQDSHKQDGQTPKVQHHFNVLLLTLPESGNIAPLLALGEELATRGHNITLLTTHREERNFANITKLQAERVGIVYKSAPGKSVFNIDKFAKGSKKDLLTILSMFLNIMPGEQGALMASVDDYLNQNQVDVVICTELLQPIMACLNSAYQIPVIALGTTLQYQTHTYPAWPWPGVLSGFSSDDLTIVQRFWNILEYCIGHVLVFKHVLMRPVMYNLQRYCPNAGLSYASSAPGVYLPHIVQSVIGFEYPRTITPLTSYVGPILTKSPDPIADDLMKWLNAKKEKKVIYISMGSILALSREEILTILNSILGTDYSAVWALKTKTEDALIGVDIDPDRIYITEWAPQLSVLSHKSIGMAILHGGSNGLHEALYNEVPPIVLPVNGDQFANAGRIYYHKLGIHILMSNISQTSLTDAIIRIDNAEYRSNVARLKRSFVAAGGVKRAADLVELYEAVGYSHLIPSYAKYNWSWIQYYNVDVILIITASIIILFTPIVIFCCFCTYKKVCNFLSSSVNKQKSD